MLVQMVNIRVRPGQRDAFVEAFRINLEGSRREPGNLRFDLLNDPEDDHNFFVYEVFRDEAALEAHRFTDHYRLCVAAIDPITVGARTKRYFAPVIVD
jgi:autoinducer 2-degrading protein